MRSSAFLPALFIASALSTSAQIVHTDVVPDQVYNLMNDTCLLDLDNNAQVDLIIRLVRDTVGPYCPPPCLFSMTHPYHVFVDPMPGNQIADSVATYVSELSSGDTIDGSLLWGADASQLLAENGGPSCFLLNGNWYCFLANNGNANWGFLTGETGFVGVQFLISGSIHYGWARLSIHRNGVEILDFTLMDYAYNSVPNEPIAAGDTLSISTAISEDVPGPQFSVFPDPFVEGTTIQCAGTHRMPCLMIISDPSGREVRRILLRESKTLMHREGLASGVYLYRVNNDRRIASGRMVIE